MLGALAEKGGKLVRSESVSTPAMQYTVAADTEPTGQDVAETVGPDEWSLLSWVESAGTHRAVFAALRRAVIAQQGTYSSQIALAFVRGLVSREAVATALLPDASTTGVRVTGTVLEAIIDSIWEAAQRLADAAAATGSQLNDKFASAGFTLQYGDLNTFFGGLEGKIGPPSIKVFEAMEAEHTQSADSLDAFTTGNYGVTTTPKTEWAFVVYPERPPEFGWPEEARLRGTAHEGNMRTPLPTAEMEARREATNVRLRAQHEPEVMREEVIAGRAYTGYTHRSRRSNHHSSTHRASHHASRPPRCACLATCVLTLCPAGRSLSSTMICSVALAAH